MPALTLDRPAVADSSVDRSATITAAVTMAIGLPTAPTTGPMATIGPITATATGPTVIMVMGVAGATRRIAHNARPSEVQEHPILSGFGLVSALFKNKRGMENKHWGWLFFALGLIGLGITIAMVVKMPA